MKDEENKYLLGEKVRSGKEEEQAIEEIENLKQSQVEFVNLNRKLKRLERELEKKDKKIEKLINKQMKIDFGRETGPIKKVKEIEKAKDGVASVNDLNRVMGIIDVESKIGLNELTKSTALKPKKCKQCLNFLIRNNFVKQYKKGSTLMLEKNGNS